MESRSDNLIADPAASRAKSAASWPAIAAGAVVAASASSILLALGSGLGFASISPWPSRGVSATTFTVTAAIWLVVMQWVSAGLGGYIAGRLRVRWVGTHTHEVFFRDTAHGLVTWAVATVLIAISALTTFDAASNRAPVEVEGTASHSPAAAYRLDKLFRTADPTVSAVGTAEARLEAGHIAAEAAITGGMPDADRTYLADLIAVRTGVAPAESQRRVDEFAKSAMQAQTKARNVATQIAIYTALSMLIGAFIASVSAALGGRQRDMHL